MSDQNNIEDFFNRSMDSFDGEPSDAVWKGLRARMEAEQPFWKKALFRWLALGVALWLLSFGLYRQLMLSELDAVLVDHNRISIENQNLQKALADCSTLTAARHTDSLTQGSFATTQPLTGLSLHLDLQAKLTPFEKTTIFDYSTSKLPALSGFSPDAFQQKMSSFYTTAKTQQEELISAGEEQWLVAERADTTGLAAIESKVIVKLENENNKTITNTESKAAAIPIQKLPLTTLSFPATKAAKVANPKIDNWHRGLAGTLMLQQQLKLIEVYRFKPSLRFGVSGGSFTTLTDLDSDFLEHFDGDLRTNHDAAFVLQWQLFRRMALTTELGYNWQAYERSFSATEQNTVMTFPNTENLSSPVERIRVKSQYIDLPVGLKFNLGARQPSRSFYLNPGVSWQMWMPQQFSYKTTSGGDLRYQEDRYFLYFGTVFLNMGMEYRLSDRIHWNIGLTTESSLTDYGLEDRAFFNLGFKAGILFGR